MYDFLLHRAFDFSLMALRHNFAISKEVAELGVCIIVEGRYIFKGSMWQKEAMSALTCRHFAEVVSRNALFVAENCVGVYV